MKKNKKTSKVCPKCGLWLKDCTCRSLRDIILVYILPFSDFSSSTITITRNKSPLYSRHLYNKNKKEKSSWGKTNNNCNGS